MKNNIMKKFLSLILFCFLIAGLSAQSGRENALQYLEKNKPLPQNSGATAILKSAARLFGAKDDLTTVIMIIPSGSKVTVLDTDSTYYRVSFEENEGYILKRQAVIDKTSSDKTSLSNNKTQAPLQQTQPVQSRQISRFSYLEDKYGTSLAARINSGKIWKGMSAEMVRDSWGNPQKINTIITGNIVKEEWIYKNTWLYVQDNTLVQWGPVRR